MDNDHFKQAAAHQQCERADQRFAHSAAAPKPEDPAR
ncbi:unnamed protein product, partial [marine sediment metagenome]